MSSPCDTEAYCVSTAAVAGVDTTRADVPQCTSECCPWVRITREQIHLDDSDAPSGWIQYDDGMWAPVDEYGMPGDPITLDVADLSESDAPAALAAAVLYLDPLDAFDHSRALDTSGGRSGAH